MRKTGAFLGQTIYGLSSGTLPSGIAVIRVSGKESKRILEGLDGRAILSKRYPPRKQVYMPLVGKEGLIDQSLATYFPSPHSFTGEDIVELSVHGSRASVAKLLSTLAQFPNTRPATRGEFTERAFLHGKLDMIQVEGLADLLHAHSEQQRQLALTYLEGDFSKRCSTWRSQCLTLLVHLEGMLDFSEDLEDQEQSLLSSCAVEVDQLAASLAHYQERNHGEKIHAGFTVGLIGRVNVGKSSLCNALSRAQHSLVSDIPGTTRDVINVPIDINGYAILLKDIAGLRESDDPVERMGIERAKQVIEEVDIKVIVLDPSDVYAGMDDFQHWRSFLTPYLSSSSVLVINKKDQLAAHTLLPFLEKLRNAFPDQTILTTSALLQDIGPLVDALTHLCKDMVLPPTQDGIYIKARHAYHIQQSHHHLLSASHYLSQASQLDLAAEAIRLASHEIGQITHPISLEDTLDHLFDTFCIGK